MKRRVSPFHSFLNSIIDFVFIIIKYKNMRFLQKYEIFTCCINVI